MSIQEEIQQQKAIRHKQGQEYHKNALIKARAIIPKVSETMKKIAIHLGSKENNVVYHRGLFRKTKYIKITLKCTPAQNENWFYALNNCPEVYGELAKNIEMKGLKNVSISRSEWNEVFIYAELDLY